MDDKKPAQTPKKGPRIVILPATPDTDTHKKGAEIAPQRVTESEKPKKKD